MGLDDKKPKNSLTTTSASPSDFTPSLDIWHKDGSVVLVTEKTAFRVHTSILASNCEVFRDMANIPQPSADDDGAETHENCPVIRLGDTAVDMKHFLQALYDFAYFRPGKKTKFPVVAAVLRLSTKYEAPQLRRRAIDLLSTAYPSTLAAWDNRSKTRLVPPFEGEICAILSLAIENDVRVVLPGLFRAASKRSLPTMLNELHNLQLNEGTRQNVIEKFVAGRDSLRQAEVKHILPFLELSFYRPACRNANDCLIKLTNQRNASFIKLMDPTESYQKWCDENPTSVGETLHLCDVCSGLVKESISAGRQKIWDGLPEMYGLPGWETLVAENDIGEDSAEED